MRFGSVCSGIEAASVAWQPLGWKAQWLSEIEPFPCALLAHHYPNTPNLGDMTKFESWPTDDQHAIDLLCGGTPCQSFSVAGLRKGLDDPRGNLMLTFGAIAAKYRPQWLVWENVPGVLSSNGGRDFGAFLGLLGILGYGFAYRVLDAQYFGVAQRRRRVFVVGCLGDWRRAAAVLFERHSLSGHPAPSRQAGKTVTPTIRAGAANGGAGHGARSGDSKDELIVPVVGTLGCNTGPNGHGFGDFLNNQAVDAGHIVTHSLRGEGFDASEDGTGRGTPLVPMTYATKLHNTASNGAGKFYENYTASLDANSPPPAIVFDTAQITSKANRSRAEPGLPASTLSKGSDMHVAVAQPITFSSVQSNQGINAEIQVSQTLESKNPMAVAVFLRGREGGATAELGDEIGNCLRASGGGGDKAHVLAPVAYVGGIDNENNGFSMDAVCGPLMKDSPTGGGRPLPAVAFQSSQSGVRIGDTHATLDANNGPRRYNGALQGMQVRRLTPVECERLQGFPDGYTAIPWRKKPAADCPDGPRYKALGNSWAVPNVRWIGERIAAVAAIKEAA